MHGRVALVVIVAWQRFNAHISLITVLASNISRVSVKKCGDDRSWQRYCGLLLYGSCHIWIPFPWPLSTSHESASGARLKAYGGIQPRVKAQTKPFVQACFPLLRQTACGEIRTDLKNLMNWSFSLLIMCWIITFSFICWRMNWLVRFKVLNRNRHNEQRRQKNRGDLRVWLLEWYKLCKCTVHTKISTA